MTGVFRARNAKAMFAKTFAKIPPKTIATAFGQMTVKLVFITKRVTAHPPSAPAPMATNPAAAPRIAARNAKLNTIERRVAPSVFRMAAS